MIVYTCGIGVVCQFTGMRHAGVQNIRSVHVLGVSLKTLFEIRKGSHKIECTPLGLIRGGGCIEAENLKR